MNFAPLFNPREEIRHTGAIYTPAGVAEALAAFVSNLVPASQPKILEPSVGDGAFVKPISKHFPAGHLTCIDLNDEVVTVLRATAHAKIDTDYSVGDFIKFACDGITSQNINFNLIIGNPPFIRKHNFSLEFKGALDELAAATGYPLSFLKNSWAAFLVASTELLANDGVLAFVIPYELMTVAYGHHLLNWAAARYGRIDLFVSDQKAFPEIDQDAIIFVAQKQPSTPKGIFVQRVTNMEQLRSRIEHELTVSDGGNLALELNSFLIPESALSLIKRLHRETLRISDYCTNAPGIVTAANEFFILTEEKAKELSLTEHTLPVLKKGSFASRLPIFSAEDFSTIAAREPCRFLRLQGNREDLPAPVQAYLTLGEKLGFDQRYKCRNRTNWYEVPLVPRAPGFIFKRSHEYPRMCLNEADVFITDTAYGLKAKDGFSMRGLCFSFYNSLTLLFTEIDGRFYGGGVLELSPNEFRGLPVVYHEPSDEEFGAFLIAHADPKGITSILDFGDKWLGEKLSLDEAELKLIRQTWLAVRSHRLRHGKALLVSKD